MDEKTARLSLVQTGRELLESGLVARTWGNISCRLDSKSCMITPSGLDYMTMSEEKIVRLDMKTGEWHGRYKPSGEKGIHIAAYEIFPDAGFVIHTHQSYATAIGLAGFDSMDITNEEIKRLGGIGISLHSLSGTAELTANVRKVLSEGKKTILMAHHGALLCGKDRAEAMDRAMLLERICERNVRKEEQEEKTTGSSTADVLKTELAGQYRYSDVFSSPSIMKCADSGMAIYAQLDDMAQMIGRKIPVADEEKAVRMMESCRAVLVPGAGAAVRAENYDDVEAMKQLVEKSCICRLHTESQGIDARLSLKDTDLMNYIYYHEYSKQKSENDINGMDKAAE